MLASPLYLISTLISFYMICVIVWAIASTLVSFNIVSLHQPVMRKLMDVLDRLVQPALRPIQRIMPDLGGIDLSPIVLLLLLSFLQQFILGLGDARMAYLALVGLISTLLTLFAWCVGIYAVLNLLINFKLVNAYQPLVHFVMNVLRRLCGPLVMKIRRVVPPMGNIDVAPFILLGLLIVANHLLLRLA